MPSPEFCALKRALVAAEVAPRFVYRTIQELRDHFEDLETDAIASGLTSEEARAAARSAIGTDDAILAAFACRDEFKRWPCRWPRSAALFYMLSYYAVLPAAPVFYCAHHSGAIARWSASAGLGTVVTGTILFTLQLAVS